MLKCYLKVLVKLLFYIKISHDVLQIKFYALFIILICRKMHM